MRERIRIYLPPVGEDINAKVAALCAKRALIPERHRQWRHVRIHAENSVSACHPSTSSRFVSCYIYINHGTKTEPFRAGLNRWNFGLDPAFSLFVLKGCVEFFFFFLLSVALNFCYFLSRCDLILKGSLRGIVSCNWRNFWNGCTNKRGNNEVVASTCHSTGLMPAISLSHNLSTIFCKSICDTLDYRRVRAARKEEETGFQMLSLSKKLSQYLVSDEENNKLVKRWS